MEKQEYQRLQRFARRSKMSLGQWVRQVFRTAAAEQSETSPEKKIQALRLAARFQFPAGDIDQMLSEIDQGYQDP